MDRTTSKSELIPRKISSPASSIPSIQGSIQGSNTSIPPRRLSLIPSDALQIVQSQSRRASVVGTIPVNQIFKTEKKMNEKRRSSLSDPFNLGIPIHVKNSEDMLVIEDEKNQVLRRISKRRSSIGASPLENVRFDNPKQINLDVDNLGVALLGTTKIASSERRASFTPSYQEREFKDELTDKFMPLKKTNSTQIRKSNSRIELHEEDIQQVQKILEKLSLDSIEDKKTQEEIKNAPQPNTADKEAMKRIDSGASSTGMKDRTFSRIGSNESSKGIKEVIALRESVANTFNRIKSDASKKSGLRITNMTPRDTMDDEDDLSISNDTSVHQSRRTSLPQEYQNYKMEYYHSGTDTTVSRDHSRVQTVVHIKKRRILCPCWPFDSSNHRITPS